MRVSEYLKKIFARPRAKAAQSGQAVIEYILVLVVVVSIILGILYQFNDAFKQYLDRFFGDYIACLLETGELPSLGGDGPSSSECVTPFQEFSISAGRNLAGGDSSQGNGNSGNSENGSGNGSGNGGDSSSSSSGGGGSNNSNSNLRPANVVNGGGVANSDSRKNLGNGGLRPSRQIVNKSVVQGKDGKNTGGFGDSNDSGGFGRRGGRRIIRRRRIIYLGDNYLDEEKKKKQSVASAASTKAKAKSGADGDGLREPLLKIKKKKVFDKMESDTGFKMGFGNFIKFLLIGGILIAIFIFLGGQAVQIKKSWQKAD